MSDIWGFLLQTLTASGVAILLLAIKALFKDKLPPKWHFAVWGVLGIMLLVPAGWSGRYTLIHWQYVIELIKGLVKDFSFTRVLFPIPLISSLPRTVADWFFFIYTIGVILHLANYFIAYIRLRVVLNKGQVATGDITTRVQELAKTIKVKPCQVIEVKGLPSAFVCGIIRTVLVIRAGEPLDDKVLLHELMHLKSKDTLWSVVICILRSLHWCNPLIVYCASRATNDMESRCDQFVLEHLEGEERREYGQILLSMVNERFAKTPGTTCVNNGGKHIKERIETIARFKKYPVGMGLVSICVLVLLTVSLIIGVQASKLYEPNHSAQLESFASARSIPCTTYAGAFDAYGKAVLAQNGYYRTMCAPYSMQKALYDELITNTQKSLYPEWKSGLPAWPNEQEGYYVYNLTQPKRNVYEGLMVFKLNYPPDGQPEEYGKIYLAVQNLRVEKENGRWVAIPLEDFRNIEALDQSLGWGCMELPGVLYTCIVGDFRVEVNVQTVYTVDSTVENNNDINFMFVNSYFYDTTPKPNAKFTRAARTQSNGVMHLGSQEDRDLIEGLGISLAPVYKGEKRPTELPSPGNYGSGGGSNTGESWSSIKTSPGWGPYTELAGGGGGTFDPERNAVLPEFYVADFYVDGKLVDQIDLYPQKEVAE